MSSLLNSRIKGRNASTLQTGGSGLARTREDFNSAKDYRDFKNIKNALRAQLEQRVADGSSGTTSKKEKPVGNKRFHFSSLFHSSFFHRGMAIGVALSLAAATFFVSPPSLTKSVDSAMQAFHKVSGEVTLTKNAATPVFELAAQAGVSCLPGGSVAKVALEKMPPSYFTKAKTSIVGLYERSKNFFNSFWSAPGQSSMSSVAKVMTKPVAASVQEVDPLAFAPKTGEGLLPNISTPYADGATDPFTPPAWAQKKSSVVVLFATQHKILKQRVDHSTITQVLPPRSMASIAKIFDGLTGEMFNALSTQQRDLVNKAVKNPKDVMARMNAAIVLGKVFRESPSSKIQKTIADILVTTSDYAIAAGKADTPEWRRICALRAEFFAQQKDYYRVATLLYYARGETPNLRLSQISTDALVHLGGKRIGEIIKQLDDVWAEAKDRSKQTFLCFAPIPFTPALPASQAQVTKTLADGGSKKQQEMRDTIVFALKELQKRAKLADALKKVKEEQKKVTPPATEPSPPQSKVAFNGTYSGAATSFGSNSM